MFKPGQKISILAKSPIIVNSSWGIISQVLQSVLLSLFFILIARNYSTGVFANFIIAMVLYQLISAFSSLGLSQWFVREITGLEDKRDLINKFFKIQIYSGIIFYLINIGLGFLLYSDFQIRILTIFFGINIIFDNLINAIKCLNISEFKQKKTFIILSIEAFLKFAVTCFLFVYPFSIITLSIILVIVRFMTLNLFLNLGSSRLINLKQILQHSISFNYIKTLIKLNWPFIIIGSVSIINWRISTVIISKALAKIDVANFEISYRIFSIALMLPVVISATVFPILINFFKENKISELSAFYRKIHVYYFLFGLFSFTFIYSFIDFLLPIAFGVNYIGTGIYTKQMFLTILVFPTAFLQANVLIALKLERLDMWFNIALLTINLVLCTTGLFFFKSLTVINISIFLSFLCFHILQDIVLFKKKISSRKHIFKFYIISIVLIGCYLLLSKIFSPLGLFLPYWIAISCLFILINNREGRYKNKMFPVTIL
jgi:O-antigen/teichoic acid export membrane protein